jgi:formamidopyrimidine-DNA glycosylase
MPELPEVETVVRDLRPLVTGRTITDLSLSTVTLRRPWQSAWTTQILGKRFLELRRRGKWILCKLDDQAYLLVHLGMTGQLTVAEKSQVRADHTHLIFQLDQTDELRFRDIRRFGSVEWYPNEERLTAELGPKLGPEPDAIPAEWFAEQLQRTRRPIKAALLDQALVAGVGNIYADEALFQARLHPQRLGVTLTTDDCDRLRQAIEMVITRAISQRGSTIRDYVGGSGLKGEYQNELMVYGRTGEACPVCHAEIHCLRVGGRSSHFCATCQAQPSD